MNCRKKVNIFRFVYRKVLYGEETASESPTEEAGCVRYQDQ